MPLHARIRYCTTTPARAASLPRTTGQLPDSIFCRTRTFRACTNALPACTHTTLPRTAPAPAFTHTQRAPPHACALGYRSASMPARTLPYAGNVVHFARTFSPLHASGVDSTLIVIVDAILILEELPITRTPSLPPRLQHHTFHTHPHSRLPYLPGIVLGDIGILLFDCVHRCSE